jgi:hypothetical protein
MELGESHKYWMTSVMQAVPIHQFPTVATVNADGALWQ